VSILCCQHECRFSLVICCAFNDMLYNRLLASFGSKDEETYAFTCIWCQATKTSVDLCYPCDILRGKVGKNAQQDFGRQPMDVSRGRHHFEICIAGVSTHCTVV
jgi:hypothetical protein